MPKLADSGDKVLTMVPEASGMKCMACCFGCGTPLTGVMKIEGDSLAMTENTYCFCLKASPCPCLGCCCCDGPHVQYPRFKKVSDTKYVADGTESFFKGGCCVGACNNKGDAIELMDDGKIWWHAGDNNAVPPCIGKNAQKVASMKVGGGAPPTNATMER